jgi:hypothetical protein
LTLGIVGVVVIQMILEHAREDDPNEIFDELADQLAALEAHVKQARE